MKGCDVYVVGLKGRTLADAKARVGELGGAVKSSARAEGVKAAITSPASFEKGMAGLEEAKRQGVPIYSEELLDRLSEGGAFDPSPLCLWRPEAASKPRKEAAPERVGKKSKNYEVGQGGGGDTTDMAGGPPNFKD